LNLNTRHGHTHRGNIDKAYQQQKIVMGDFSSAPPGDVYSDSGNFLTNIFATWMSFSAGEPVTYMGDPITNVYVPMIHLALNESLLELSMLLFIGSPSSLMSYLRMCMV
jgi:hypothetical protein